MLSARPLVKDGARLLSGHSSTELNPSIFIENTLKKHFYMNHITH